MAMGDLQQVLLDEELARRLQEEEDRLHERVCLLTSCISLPPYYFLDPGTPLRKSVQNVLGDSIVGHGHVGLNCSYSQLPFISTESQAVTPLKKASH